MELITDTQGYKQLLGRLEMIVYDAILKGSGSFPDLHAWMIYEGAPVFTRLVLTRQGNIVSAEASDQPPHWFLDYTALIEHGDGRVRITQVPWPTPKYVLFTSKAEEALAQPDAAAGDKALIVSSDGRLIAYVLKAHALAVLEHRKFLGSLYRENMIEEIVKRGEKLVGGVKLYPVQQAVLHVIDGAFSGQAEALKKAIYEEFGHMPTVMSDPGFQFGGSVEIPPLCEETSRLGKFVINKRTTVNVQATYAVKPINAATINQFCNAVKSALPEGDQNYLPPYRGLHSFP